VSGIVVTLSRARERAGVRVCGSSTTLTFILSLLTQEGEERRSALHRLESFERLNEAIWV
jgi:hypothetical protein